MITRPLLAGKVENFSKIQYPVYATPKLDGIRVLKVAGKTVTRKFKQLPNVFTRTQLDSILLDGMDGEVMLREGTFNEIQSRIMSFDGDPDFIVYLFDYVKDSLNTPYLDRVNDLKEWHDTLLLDSEGASKVKLVIPTKIDNEEELLAYEQKALALGYEGVMIRTAESRYKCGRSTENEGILLKLKRFEDAEAEVLGFTEKLRNDNAQEEDEFGLSKRSHKKDGKVPSNTLGALLVKDISTGIEFEVGTGFDDATKKEIWDNQPTYINKLIKYKFQPVGVKEKPRFPVFLGFRSLDDL